MGCAALKTVVRKDLWVRVPRPPLRMTWSYASFKIQVFRGRLTFCHSFAIPPGRRLLAVRSAREDCVRNRDELIAISKFDDLVVSNQYVAALVCANLNEFVFAADRWCR